MLESKRRPAPDERAIATASQNLDSIDAELLPLTMVLPNSMTEVVAKEPFSSLLQQNGNTVLVAAFQRSGSTYTTQTLARLMNYKSTSLVHAKGRSDHELYVPYILARRRDNRIAQHHMKATDENLALIVAFKMTVIALVRRIDEVLMSLVYWIRNNPITTPYTYYESAASWTDDELLEYLIEYRAAWFLDFYLSWAHAARQNPQITIASYESMIRDEQAYFRDLCGFLGKDAGTEEILRSGEEVRKRGQARLTDRANSGYRLRLSQNHQRRLQEIGRTYERAYPWLDLGRVLPV